MQYIINTRIVIILSIAFHKSSANAFNAFAVEPALNIKIATIPAAIRINDITVFIFLGFENILLCLSKNIALRYSYPCFSSKILLPVSFSVRSSASTSLLTFETFSATVFCCIIVLNPASLFATNG